ncbi:type II secretion system minor pseudopilin GspJ [Deefgea rivuli]|uniref:type II secretion system minor pseudopilin GspJ n=1 Tax=Deefgea rivuli TaxID=400948 RepID=UPI0004814D29|nr:type II secretion system minor pseudopilin GspJ [Deefgea rivuli]
MSRDLNVLFSEKYRTQNQSKHCGFTLLEVLVALAIFAIMSLITYRGVNMVIDTRTAVVSETAYWRELTLAFERMESDLSQLVPRPWTDASGKIQPPLRSVSNPDASVGLEFIRFDADRAPLHGIYQCRQRSLILKLFPKPDIAAGELAISHELLKNLSRCEIDFLDSKNQWRPQWNEAASRPRAIRIRLAVDQHLGEYERVFLIP